MVSGPPCAACTFPLRWIQEQNGWGCERCHRFFPNSDSKYNPFPSGGDAPQPAPAPLVAAKSKAPIYIAVGAGVLALFVVIGVVAGGGGGGGGSSPDGVAKDAIAALSAGDVDELMNLADIETAINAAMECDTSGGDTYGIGREHKREVERTKKKFQQRVDDLAGATLEFVDVVEQEAEREAMLSKGQRIKDGCVAKADIMNHLVKVRVKVSEKGAAKPYEQTVRMEVIEIGDRFYLGKVRTIELQGGDADESISKIEKFATEMCGCQDKTCADRVQEGFTRWGTDMAKQSRHSGKVTEEATKRMTDAATRYSECYTKILTRNY
jgi:hypothetical protein